MAVLALLGLDRPLDLASEDISRRLRLSALRDCQVFFSSYC
jgi:hypothetical protein